MRISTVFRKLLGVICLIVTDVRFVEGAVVVGVKPRWRLPRCGECGEQAGGYDRKKPRRWRDLAFGHLVIQLEYAPRRVACGRCDGVRVEAVPWAAHGSWFTERFEEMTAHLARSCDKTTVSKLLGISWETVGNIVQRVVSRSLDDRCLQGLKRIGVDEFSYRKRHRYVTVVVDHDTGRVVWASKGHGAEAFHEFFDDLGEEGVEQLELVTLDMAAGYLKAVRERAPHVEIVFDRFHVAQLASRAVDEVRRELWRENRDTEAGKVIKGSRYALLKSPWNLNLGERVKLAALQKTNEPLYRAYLLKESLADALDRRTTRAANKALDDWLSWASRSRLKPFMKLAKTIRRHRDGILAYVEHGMTNAVVEGVNNRMRSVARRAFGYHSASALIGMMFLCVGGVVVNPPLPSSPTQR